MQRLLLLSMTWMLCTVSALAAEYNPIRSRPPSIGPEAHRIIVGFRASAGNAVVQMIKMRTQAKLLKVVRAKTVRADVDGLAARIGLSMARSRQIAPDIHVVYLQRVLYGADVTNMLARLRADPAVKFADVDQLRYPATVPNDPLFAATSGATGQWYMQPPSGATGDLSATDAVSAWTLSTGSTGTVIADVDSGVRFDHPDLLRAGFGGRLLPGYDFVDQDYDVKTGAALGTYLRANDGDGWDPDPSDPGDWINSTDQKSSLFPSSDCTIEDSSWHGTRVMGILGAVTNNGSGVAGMTWGPWILPVRALGKCGGYDSDIIAGIEWAAGLSVSTAENNVPDNPYPASIINLSLGGAGTCPSAYKDALSAVTGLGVLVVASAGNASGGVDAPANCSTVVSGVIAVAGLRNVGTKVGYSSFGPEVGVSAPAGNCINSSGACLRSIDTTVNLGLTIPGSNSYTNQIEPNLGTSFSAPIVSGVAALMRAVNGTLSPAQLVSRLKSSATPFPPNMGNVPVCPAADPTSGECACPATGECGTGMVNALSAVNEALRPGAAVSFPAAYNSGSAVTFDASRSGAACNRTLRSYAWSGAGGLTFLSRASNAQVTVSGTGTLTVTVTDSAGATDTATIAVGATSAATSAPAAAGTTACVAALTVSPVSPTMVAAFSPTSVGTTVNSTLTVTLSNANPFDLTQVGFTDTLPTALVIAASPAPATSCGGAGKALTNSASSISLANAIIPANGTCNITVSVAGSSAGTYQNDIAAGALTTGPAGPSTEPASAALIVTAPLAPTVAAAFSPGSVATSSTSTLTVTLRNTNGYPLTGAALSASLPANLGVGSSPAASTSCQGSVATTSTAINLTGATLPAGGACTVSVPVASGTAGSYALTIPAGALTDAQSAPSTASASATLTVTAPSHGGGAVDGWELLAGATLVFSRWRRQRQCLRVPADVLPSSPWRSPHHPTIRIRSNAASSRAGTRRLPGSER